MEFIISFKVHKQIGRNIKINFWPFFNDFFSPTAFVYVGRRVRENKNEIKINSAGLPSQIPLGGPFLFLFLYDLNGDRNQQVHTNTTVEGFSWIAKKVAVNCSKNTTYIWIIIFCKLPVVTNVFIL